MLAYIGAVLRLEILIFAINAFFHALAQNGRSCPSEEPIPAGAPQHLDDVPAGAVKKAFEFLHDLAVAAHRAIEPL